MRYSFDNPSPGEYEHRRIQDCLNRAHHFQERVERIIPSHIPHKEPMLDLLPHLSDPWPSGYRTLAKTLAPIDDLPPRGVTPHNPDQTFNPAVSNPRYVSSPPIPFVAKGESSAQMVSVHSNVGGKPPCNTPVLTSFSFK